jgi:hypothetical protein
MYGSLLLRASLVIAQCGTWDPSSIYYYIACKDGQDIWPTAGHHPSENHCLFCSKGCDISSKCDPIYPTTSGTVGRDGIQVPSTEYVVVSFR